MINETHKSFFETATGLVDELADKKITVGVFLGNLAAETERSEAEHRQLALKPCYDIYGDLS